MHRGRRQGRPRGRRDLGARVLTLVHVQRLTAPIRNSSKMVTRGAIAMAQVATEKILNGGCVNMIFPRQARKYMLLPYTGAGRDLVSLLAGDQDVSRPW